MDTQSIQMKSQKVNNQLESNPVCPRIWLTKEQMDNDNMIPDGMWERVQKRRQEIAQQATLDQTL